MSMNKIRGFFQRAAANTPDNFTDIWLFVLAMGTLNNFIQLSETKRSIDGLDDRIGKLKLQLNWDIQKVKDSVNGPEKVDK
jgi:hypothetical protein